MVDQQKDKDIWQCTYFWICILNVKELLNNRKEERPSSGADVDYLMGMSGWS